MLLICVQRWLILMQWSLVWHGMVWYLFSISKGSSSLKYNSPCHLKWLNLSCSASANKVLLYFSMCHSWEEMFFFYAQCILHCCCPYMYDLKISSVLDVNILQVKNLIKGFSPISNLPLPLLLKLDVVSYSHTLLYSICWTFCFTNLMT